jgi:hypothetical protein
MLKTPEETLNLLQHNALAKGSCRYIRTLGRRNALCIDIVLSRTGLGGDGFLYTIGGRKGSASDAIDAISQARREAPWRVWN